MRDWIAALLIGFVVAFVVMVAVAAVFAALQYAFGGAL